MMIREATVTFCYILTRTRAHIDADKMMTMIQSEVEHTYKHIWNIKMILFCENCHTILQNFV